MVLKDFGSFINLDLDAAILQNNYKMLSDISVFN